jgi:hypothetical protein
MRQHRILGTVFATVWLLGILVLGASLPGLKPLKKDIADQPINFPAVTKPESLRDQQESVKIIKVARTIKKDFEWLSGLYKQLPHFDSNRDPHLTNADLDSFVLAYNSYCDEMTNFKNTTMGNKPGLFRVFAFYGMIFNYHQVVKTRSLVRANLTSEQFDWTLNRIMEAGLFAVLTSLDEKLYHSESQKAHFDKLREAMYWAAGVSEPGDGGTVYHMEKFNPKTIPQSNIKLFLDRYREINWSEVHFNRPTVIEFNREIILKDAANNPP